MAPEITTPEVLTNDTHTFETDLGAVVSGMLRGIFGEHL